MVAHGFSGQSALAIFTAAPVFLIKINLKHLYRTIAQLYPVLVKVWKDMRLSRVLITSVCHLIYSPLHPYQPSPNTICHRHI